MDGEQLPQVGGHGSVDKSQAMQVNREGLVLKPIQEGPRGEREVEFFITVTSDAISMVPLAAMLARACDTKPVTGIMLPHTQIFEHVFC